MWIDVETVVRLLLASLLGGLIGLEREVHGRPAGFRTHLLVSLGAALYVIASISFYRLYGAHSGPGPAGVDPGRVAAQVVAGIGFLGAGAIIREKASIRGLTTAACLWVAAAIGLATGIGLYLIAILVTVIALLSLLMLKRVENLLQRDTYLSIKVWCDDRQGLSQQVEQLLAAAGVQVMTSNLERDRLAGQRYFEFAIRVHNRVIPHPLLEQLSDLEGVRRVRIE